MGGAVMVGHKKLGADSYIRGRTDCTPGPSQFQEGFYFSKK